MTADAKVGLLLGLFFIVLIAFLINGLPTFLQESNNQDGVKTAIAAPSGPDLVIDHRVTETAQRLIPSVPLRVTETPQEVLVLSQTPQDAAPANVVPAAELPQPLQEQPPVAPVIAAQVEQLPLVPEPKPESAAANAKTHIVQKGESLGSIAQKYYGTEAGNRLAVIQKLYEANQNVLTSPDKVVVGNKLTIPNLPVSTKKASASESLLQKFSTIFERTNTPPATTPKTTKPAAAKAAKTSEYTVQSGDTLWKIAEKTLGDGRKFNTLIEMNKDRLKNPDDVVVGMKLLVPAR